MRDDLKAVKRGMENVSSTGDDLFDGIYLAQGGKRIGLVDFGAGHNPDSIRKVTFSAVGELQKGNVSHVYIVVFNKNETFQKAFKETIAIVAPDIQKRVAYLTCPEDKVEETAQQLQIENN